ncbi:DUF4307 domain-containing protein [Brachybacterium phenoliresistens]|uniref:DUF4307 domain-containing protein n=1 Tax=Brachybacterium phenoliresistens TaxID=396014 RepID=UPI0031E18DA7
MNEVPEHLHARYGGPVVPPRTARILLIAAIVVFGAVVVFLGLRFADQPVRVETVSYDHLDAEHTQVTFIVTKDPGTRATCTVQAMNAGRAQVGFVEVEIPASDARRTSHTVEIATQGDAVSAEVLGCEEV